MQRQADPDGELAMARGVSAAKSVLGVSSNAGTTFAELGATGVPWWLQIYVVRNRESPSGCSTPPSRPGRGRSC